MDEFSLPPDWYHDPLNECYTNVRTGETVCYSEELFCFADPHPSLNDINMEMGNNSSETEEPAMETPVMETPAMETPAMETAPKKKDLPMRLFFGNGPRVHSRMSIEYGVSNKRCEDCGQVGKLTCFSSSFRKWALKRVTEEEFNQTCSRCHLRGHTCVNCDLPISYRVNGLPDPKEKKTKRCGHCGEQGHDRRSCFKAAANKSG